MPKFTVYIDDDPEPKNLELKQGEGLYTQLRTAPGLKLPEELWIDDKPSGAGRKKLTFAQTPGDLANPIYIFTRESGASRKAGTPGQAEASPDKNKLIIIGAVAAAVVVLGVIGFLMSRGGGGQAVQATAQAQPTTPPAGGEQPTDTPAPTIASPEATRTSEPTSTPGPTTGPSAEPYLLTPTAQPPAGGTVVRIAVVRTGGRFEDQGVGMENAAAMAREALGPGGRLEALGQALAGADVDLQIYVENDGSDRLRAGAIARGIVADPSTLCVVGHYNSESSLEGGPEYGQADLLVFTPASTNPQVTIDGPTMWRVVANDTRQGKVLYDIVAADPRSQNGIVIVHVGNNVLADGEIAPNEFAIGVKDAFLNARNQSAQQQPVNGILTFDRPQAGDPDLSGVISDLQQAAKPGLLVFIGTSEELTLLVNGLGPDFKSLPVYGISTLDQPANVNALRDQGYAIKYTTLAAPSEVGIGLIEDWFVSDYAARFGPPPPQYAAETYDSVYLCARALAKTIADGQALTRDNVRQAMVALVAGGEEFPRGPDQTAAGRYIFNTTSRELERSIVVLRASQTAWEWYGCNQTTCSKEKEGTLQPGP